MDTLRFNAAVELQGASAGKPARVTILAYTGGSMRIDGWGEMAVDLAGLEMAGTIPILVDHDSRISGIAGSGTPRVEAGTLIVEGTIAGSSAGKRVRQLAVAGVPFQASIGVAPMDLTPVKAGDMVTVNGQTIKAGLKGMRVVKTGRLKEVSILSLGADSATSVSIAAKARGSTVNDDVDEIEVPDATLTERDRCRAIRVACNREHPDIEAQAIDEGWDLTATTAALLKAVRSRRATVPSAPGNGHSSASARDQLTAAALLMGGHDDIALKAFGERVVSQVEKPHGWHELTAMALRAEGRDVPRDRNELLRAGFSTVSLPNALGLGVTKIALEAFTESSTNWRAIVRPVSVPDFKDGKAIRISPATRLVKIGPGAEIKHASITDEDVFTFRVETYAKMIQLTRADIVNDDLGLLDSLPRILGSEASRTVADLTFDSVIANVDQDGNDYWSDAHGNLIHDALDVTSLGEALRIIRTRTDSDGRIIGFNPATLLVPAALEQTARALLNSLVLQRDQSSDMQPTANPLNSVNLALVVEPRLDADSETDWYVFSRASEGAFLFATLNGKAAPVVESEAAPFNVLGMAWRCYFDGGIASAEYRSAVKSDVAPYA